MNIVRELRKKKGIQQKELALVIGVAQPTISDWEANKKDPSGDRLKKLADYFGVDELMILGKGLVDLSQQHDEAPRTIEARIVSAGMDRMSKEDREFALEMFRRAFASAFDQREGEPNEA